MKNIMHDGQHRAAARARLGKDDHRPLHTVSHALHCRRARRYDGRMFAFNMSLPETTVSIHADSRF
ncbi:MAG: hypothetical protein UHD09_06355 [Bifidobacterium sp.]|nr:hypothetical protein [Bifidobacterium sp.]